MFGRAIIRLGIGPHSSYATIMCLKTDADEVPFGTDGRRRSYVILTCPQSSRKFCFYRSGSLVMRVDHFPRIVLT